MHYVVYFKSSNNDWETGALEYTSIDTWYRLINFRPTSNECIWIIPGTLKYGDFAP